MKKIQSGSASPPKSSFSNLYIKDGMRRHVISLPADSSLETAIGKFIKFKANAILIVDEHGAPLGVVSKTEVIGAYYASLPVTSPVSDIMGTPALTCFPDDTLECGLATMQEKNIHRLYVIDRESGQAIGVLAYPDIVGLLYRFCRKCEYSRHNTRKRKIEDAHIPKILVGDIMNPNVQSAKLNDSTSEIIEVLSMHKLGALLITNSSNIPRGVISKTDLALAYKRGKELDTPARQIMTSPVASCAEKEILENGIHRMIFAEINRLYVFRDSPKDIVGVLSLAAAAKVRSGSCQACSGSKLSV